MLFTGSMTALVTPFRDGRVDEKALRSLIDWQIASGTDVLVPCGTTGEAATLTDNERAKVIEICALQSAGRAMVLAGAGSNCTETAIRLARLAKSKGADGTLQVTPYYNKPTQEGLYEHFRAIALTVDLPLVLYNVPGRTAVNMLVETTLKLADVHNIKGIKEASGDLEQIKNILDKRPQDFSVLSGDDHVNLAIYKIGGNGCISVTANIVPDKVAGVWDMFNSGKLKEADGTQDWLEPLNKAMFIETNPIPAKTALAMMGRIKEEFRLPMTPMNEGRRRELASVLKEKGVI